MNNGPPAPADLTLRLRQSQPIPLDLELTCPAGQLTALFGPSGSGKTTVLRSIAGLHEPADARVACGAEVWTDTVARSSLPPHRRPVGFVFQDFALFPHLSARGNVQAAMNHLPRGQRRARAEELLAAVHLEALTERRPATLSGGEQQRVAMARALARDPRVLLLDEPFAAVDRPVRDTLHRELIQLRRRVGIPIVLVSHDFADVARLADRVAVLEHGRILASGPITELTAAGALPGVAGYRDPGVVLDARILGSEHDRRLTTVAAGELQLAVPLLAAQAGTVVRLEIKARDVILATSRPTAISVHNILSARVTGIESDQALGTCLVRLNATGTPLLASVTQDAVSVLRIAAGSEVFVLLKSVAVAAFGA